MKKVFSKKYWVALISSFAIGIGVILACAGGDWEEPGYYSRFTPEAFTDKAYRPFFFSDMYYYYTGYDIDHNTRFNESNIEAWTGYLQKKGIHAELEYLLQTADSTAINNTLLYFTNKLPALPDPVKTFTLLQDKRDEKTASFITYLSLAKRCEKFAVNNIRYYWDDKEEKAVFDATKINAEITRRLNQSKDKFLNGRYWFQLIRSYYYNGSPQAAVEAFEKYQSQFPSNDIYYRAMAYAAGAYYKMKNYSKANYYYSKVYDGSDLLKMTAHFSFHPQDEKDWKETLTLCKNKEEQATLWQMTGVFYEDEKRAIREIVQLDAKSEKLDLLLVRAINKEEHTFLHYADKETGPENTNKELLTLVTGIAGGGKTAKPYMWQIAAGYLYMLYGDYATSNAWYTKAGKALPAGELVKMQLRLLKLVNKAGEAKKITAQLENELLADLQWLKGFKTSDYPDFRYQEAYSWVKNTLSERYAQQKEWVKAECFKTSSPFYGDDRKIELMKAFLDKKDKTAYEQFYASLYELNKSDLLQYQAVRLTFEDKPEEAITKMQQSGTEGYLPGNPFNGRINDCHDCDHAATQRVSYTRLSLLQKMKEMEAHIKSGRDVYNNALLLGNAFYNISHYGNARAFYESKITGQYTYSPFSLDSTFRYFLVDMRQAEKYYNLALQAAQTDEQKAKCYYLLAKCERNEWYNTTHFLVNDSEYGWHWGNDFKAWDGFKALQQYSNTQYYKEVIKECGYFRTYVSKR